MHRFSTYLLALLLLAAPALAAAEQAPVSVCNLAEETLISFGTDPLLVEAVRAHNDRGLTLDTIRALDEQWVAHPGMADYMTALRTTPLAMYLRGYQRSQDHMVEIFVTGRLGAVLAMSDKTSDYWQGDEPKFTRAFADGAGALFIGDIEFDRSTQAYVTHVSVPVMDGDQAIGVITFGVDVDCF